MTREPLFWIACGAALAIVGRALGAGVQRAWRHHRLRRFVSHDRADRERELAAVMHLSERHRW